MKLLITGATGLLGVHLVKALIDEKNYQITCLLRKNSSHPFLPNQGIEIIQGDITDYTAVEQAMKDCDGVIHCAALISYRKKDWRLMENVNVKGTENMVKAAVRNNIKIFIHISTCATIADMTSKHEADEGISFTKKENYGYPETKWRAEQLVQSSCEKGLNAVIINPSMIHGAGDKNGNTAALFRNAQKKLCIAPPGGCSIVAVQDVVAGILLAIKKGKKGERYILTTENTTYPELMKQMQNVMNLQTNVVLTIPSFCYLPLYYTTMFLSAINTIIPVFPTLLTPQIIHFVFHYKYFSNEKAKKELGWEPVYDMDKALKDAYEYYKSQGIKNIN